MSKIGLELLLALIFIINLVGLSFAQGNSQNTGISMSSNVSSSTPTASTKGVNPTIGSYGGSNFDKINLFNGNVSMSFPLASLSSRGGMSVGIVLSYNSKIWRVEQTEEDVTNKNGISTTAKTFFPIYGEYDQGITPLAAGWTIHAGRLTARQAVLGKSTSCFFPSPGKPMPKPVKSLTTIVFTAPDGTEYDLRDTIYDGEYKDLISCDGVSRGNTFVSKDGTSATFVCDTNITDGLFNDQIINLNGYLYLRDGTRFRIENGRPVQQRDHNGNIVRYEYVGNQLTKVTDNMGRTITVVYGNDGHTLATVTINGFGSTPRVTTVRGDLLSHQVQVLPYGDLFPVDAIRNQVTGSFDAKVVSAIILPDQPNAHQWSFQYNVYGEVIGVITPARGKVEYDMGPSAQAGGGAGGYNETFNEIFRRVLTRRAFPSDQGPIEGTITYTDPTDVTKQDVDGNVTVTEKELDPNNGNSVVTESRHKFSGNPLKAISGRGYREWREGKELETRILNPASGSPMRTVVNQYQLRAGVSWAKDLNGNPVDNNYLFQPENDPRVIQVTSSLQDGANPKTSIVDYKYDDFNNVTSEQLTGYNGEIIRKVERTYVTNLNGFDYTGLNRNLAQTGDPNFYDIHMRSLIASETIKNGAQTIESQTTYEYDIYSSTTPHAALMPRTLTVDSQATNYQSASRILRGNVTGVTRGFGSADATTTNPQYDVLGNVVAVAGPLTNQLTTTDYSADSQFTFPTSTSQYVNDSLTGNRVLTSSRTYDFSTGLVTSSTGLNGADETTTFEYNDLLDRLTREVRPQTSKISLYPNGFGQTTYSYSAPGVFPNSVTVDTTLDNNGTERKLHSESKFDGFLRTMEQHRRDSDLSTEVVSQTFYDATGRVFKVTNPFRPNDLTAKTNGYTTSKYDPLDRVWMVETFDNAGISTGIVNTEYDTNLVTVTDQAGKKRKSETDAAGRLTKVYEPDSNNSLSLETSYSYDARSNLKQVVQGTELPQGPQQRLFTYDSLSRLTSATSPESGTTNVNGQTTYQYDQASNLISRTDPRGIVTTYKYDSLNRLKEKSYDPTSDGFQTPKVQYFYDVDPSNFLPTGVTAPNNFTFQYTLGRATAIASPTTSRDAPTGLFHTYDIGGRIAQSSQLLDGQHYITNSAYNEASLPTGHTYPSGRTIAHSYNLAGQITSVTSNAQTISDQNQYTASGALMSQHLGNGLYHQMQYNSRLQPTTITLGTSATGTNIADKWKQEYDYGVYTFDTINNATSTPSTSIIQNQNNGNIGSITLTAGANASPITQFFTYDELNRLKLAKEFSKSFDTINTIAGIPFFTGYNGDNQPATNAWLNRPRSVATLNGDIYIADNLDFNSRIRKVDSSGNITTVAGGGTLSPENPGQPATSYNFYRVFGVAAYGGEIYFLAAYFPNSGYFNVIAKIDSSGNYQLVFNLNTLNVGTNDPANFAFDQAGNIYFCFSNPSFNKINAIFKISGNSSSVFAGQVGTTGYSGDGGLATNATFKDPTTLHVDNNNLYISDAGNGAVRKIDLSTNVITTVAGTGVKGSYNGDNIPATSAQLNSPAGLATNSNGNLYILDESQFRIRKVDSSGIITTIAGNGNFGHTGDGGSATSAAINSGRLAVDQSNNLLACQLSSSTLRKVTFAQNPTLSSWSQEYKYDRFGNRLAVVGTNAQSLNILAAKNRIADAGYQYDLAGNLIADPSGKYYRYDAENRLVTAASDAQFTNIIAQYFYDGNGWRIKKAATSGTTTRFVYDQGGRLLEEFDGEPVPASNTPTREHIYGASGMLATVEPDKINYHTPDHLGSPRVLTDSTGAIISRRDFFPFGESMPNSIGGRTSIAGYSISDSIKQKFTGYQRDDETGLDFAQARYYANTNGRFISPDSIPGKVLNPQSWNRYVYVLNNPVIFNDPTGHFLERPMPKKQKGPTLGDVIFSFIFGDFVEPPGDAGNELLQGLRLPSAMIINPGTVGAATEVGVADTNLVISLLSGGTPANLGIPPEVRLVVTPKVLEEVANATQASVDQLTRVLAERGIDLVIPDKAKLTAAVNKIVSVYPRGGLSPNAEKLGRQLNDLQILAESKAIGAPLLTNNTRDFEIAVKGTAKLSEEAGVKIIKTELFNVKKPGPSLITIVETLIKKLK